MPFIDWPADDGSDDGAWLRAARDGGIPIIDYDNLIHDADGDGSDSLATSTPDVSFLSHAGDKAHG